jgi:RND family efflux transporter MFP subunit
MRLRPAIALAALIVATAPGAIAAGQDTPGPSALVQLTKLRRGSLPTIVTAYGSVRAGPSARQTVMAPLAGVVGEVDVRQGEEVAKGAALIGLGPSPQVAAAYAQAQSARRGATQLVARTRTLLGQHLATAQQLADAISAEANAHAALAALDAEGAGGPQILRAPFPAIVTAVSTSPGAIVAQGAALLDLVRPSGLVLEVGIVPEHARTVRPDQKAGIKPLGGKDAGTGTVVLRGSMVEPGTGLVAVDIALPAGPFFAGEMAQANIVTGDASGYVVPHAAILVDDSGKPYVVQAIDMVAKKVPVRVLVADANEDVIDGPLDPAAPLVLAGNYQLDNGMRVRLANPSGPVGK